jgi:hypothetical protein
MTDRNTEHAVWLTDGEIIKRMRVGQNAGRKALQEMRKHPKFPPRSIGGKTYWGSMVDFFDSWNGRRPDAPDISAGQETNHGQTTNSGRARPSLAAAEKWLGSGVAVPPGLESVPQRPVLSRTAPEQDRARYGYTDENGNYRRIVAGLRAGKIRVTGPDGRKWIEDANETDPASWQRKRKFVPRKPVTGS